MIIGRDTPRAKPYYLLGAVQEHLKAKARIDEWPGIRERMESGDYENMCKVAEEVTFGEVKVR